MKYDAYLLIHCYEYGKKKEHEEIKNLGLYSSKQKAKEAIERYKTMPGFKEHPKKSFIIQEYHFDKDMFWQEGFMSWEDA